MANSKYTIRLIEGKIKVVGDDVSKQQEIVDDLSAKLAKAQEYYDNAASKLSGLQTELDAYKADKVK